MRENTKVRKIELVKEYSYPFFFQQYYCVEVLLESILGDIPE